MSDITLTTLAAKGVSFSLVDGQLKVHYKRGTLTPQETDWLRRHKSEIIEWLRSQKVHNSASAAPGNDADSDGGRRLLYALWDAGYSLQLVASEFNPTGYVILPVGAISPSEELIRLYDAFHDQAVALFVETCHFAGIPPEEWASWAAQVAARSRKILAAERAAAEKAANKSPGAAPEPHQQDSHGQPGRITSHRRLVERNGEL